MSEPKVTQHPRVLLVNHHTFGKDHGAAIALRNLFAGWPKDRLASIYGEAVVPDDDLCAKFFRLTDDEMRLMWPIPALDRWLRREPLAAGATSTTTPSNGSHLTRLGIRIFGPDGLRVRAIITNELSRWIEEFQPDLIFTTLGNLFYIRLTAALSERFRIPVALKITDDWPHSIYRKGLFAPYLRHAMKAELQHLIASATVTMAICDSMCEAYKVRYGRDFLSVTPPVDVSTWAAESDKLLSVHTPVRVAYVGTIVRNAQLRSLKRVGDAVERIRRSGMNIELRIYTPQSYLQTFRSELERPPAVVMHEHPAQHEVASLLRQMDLLVVPVNFDQDSASYIRYSMPGKVPAYMVSGTPILVYGPEDVAPVQYARQYGWGHVVSVDDVSELESAIRFLSTDTNRRTELVRRAETVARERHDTANVRAVFQCALGGQLGHE